MSNFEKLLERLKLDEGTKTTGTMFVPYKCPAGKWTIGWGHNLEAWGIPPSLVAGILNGTGISDLQAHSLLYTDAVSAEQAVMKIIGPTWTKLNPVRQNILTNMCFNLGTEKFSGFIRMIGAVRSLEYYAAASEMVDSRWYRETGLRARRLVDEMVSGKES